MEWCEKRITLLALLVAFFLFLGLVDTLPVAGHFTRGVPYSRHISGENSVVSNMPGDHLQLYYRFWLFQDALKGNSRFYQNKYEFYTGKESAIPVHMYFFPYPLAFAAFSFLGMGAGYNAALLLSYLLSGLSMYLLAHHYTGDRLASLCAGAIFAIAPYRTASLMAGHPAGFSMFLVPLFIFAVEKTLDAKSLRYALMGGLVFWCMTDNDLHVLYLTALIAPLFVLKHFAAAGGRKIFSEVRGLLAPAALFLVVAIVPLLLPPSLTSSGAYERPLHEVRSYSPDFRDAFVRDNAVLPTAVYLGGASVLFVGAVFALGLLRRPRTLQERRDLWRLGFFLVLLLGAYLLVFGPKSPLPKPYLFLFHYLPKFNKIRQTAKLMIISSFALSVAGGLGFAYLRRALPGNKSVAALLAVFTIILIDQFPFFGTSAGISLLPREVKAYETTFRDTPDAKVINVPLWPGNDAWSSHYQYYTTSYRTIMVNGYSPTPPQGYFEEVFRPLIALNAGQIQRPQFDLLRRMGIEYLILHEESFPQKVCLFPPQYALENLLRSPYLERIASDPPVSTFRILDSEEAVGEMEFRSSVTAVVHRGRNLRGGGVVRDGRTAGGSALRLGEETAAPVVIIRRRTTPAGRYTFSLRVRTEGEPSFTVSVLSSPDKRLVASKAFTLDTSGDYRTASIDFSLEEATPIYYQIAPAPESALALEWTYLRFADQADPLPGFEFEEIYHFGNVSPHRGASGGRAVRLTGIDPVGPVTRGPYRLYGKGEYVIRLSLALGDGEVIGGEETVAAVMLRSDDDRADIAAAEAREVVMGEQRITAADFSGPEAFTPFTYPFTLERPTFLSVHVAHFGREIYLDTVTIEEVN